jgi:hypothetical protein
MQEKMKDDANANDAIALIMMWVLGNPVADYPSVSKLQRPVARIPGASLVKSTPGRLPSMRHPEPA